MSRFRGLFLVAILVVTSVVVLAISEVSVLGFNRGSDSALGLTLGLDLEGGTHLVYSVIPEDGREPTREDMEGVRNIIDKRVNEFGVSEASVQLLGGGVDSIPDRVLVQIPGQSGASITLNFGADTVSAQTLEDFFHNELGRSDADVNQNENGSLTIQLDEIQGEVLDAVGNVVTPNEADAWRDAIIAQYPVALQVGYVLPRVDPPVIGDDTAVDPVPSEDVATLPTLEEVEGAFASVGRSDADVTAVSGAEGLFSILLYGLDIASTDEDGNPIQGEDQKILTALRELGEIQFTSSQGTLTQWTLGGGIQEAKSLISNVAKLEFRYRECGDIIGPSEDIPWPPDGLTQDQWLVERCSNPAYFTETGTEIDPADLDDAFPEVSQGAIPRPIVTLVFNDNGADAFFDVTDRVSRQGDRLAIYLDGEELVAPGVSASQGGISGGRAIIEGGNFTTEGVRTIAIQLRSGALPVGLDLIQERNVDAVLGKDSLQKSLIAGAVGLVLLLIFMIAYYKVPGLVAAIALVGYSLMLLAIFKMIPVTLTLSGAAAVILSLGFAVDANILIAERTKEELRSGRSLLAAITAGFDRAWPSIRDGNMSTIIVAIVLFWFGDRFSTSVMQGFALTLAIGVLLSMFTAFFASRLLLRLLASSGLGNNPNLFVPVRDQSESADGGNS
ncbi:protein translocase subunit SecD [Candidatus Lucifugimonas marina]|uniref:Protein translocase subunit SecD n=1 Tax=Candidatus Lucifugimonas marina TaxID=3038979 RepID=A0AAJ6CVB1_9CHLR|nr:protein translocase subunit SecD [SAR202 cluster bacterium JH702]MDG0869160.1 protein translocase subunit SecD [SAR202 cluster bacterium JH639]WFG35780.1 protein translocase subunit SecD [SAR202 cluster bacterium JH545]WFG39725.1 protein translocase subunit SecD [SAR202 cluster bacterium JH1073]